MITANKYASIYKKVASLQILYLLFTNSLQMFFAKGYCFINRRPFNLKGYCKKNIFFWFTGLFLLSEKETPLKGDLRRF